MGLREWVRVLVLSDGIKEKGRERPYGQRRGGAGETLKITQTSQSQNLLHITWSQVRKPIFNDWTGLQQSLSVSCIKATLLKE